MQALVAGSACGGKGNTVVMALVRSLTALGRVRRYAPQGAPLVQGRSMASGVDVLGREGQQISDAEMSKSLLNSRISGTLTTYVERTCGDGDKAPEVPLYGSQTTYICHNDEVVMGVRNDSRHVVNLAANSICSFLLFPITPVQYNPVEVPVPRVNITGRLVEVHDKGKLNAAKETYCKIHPGIRPYLDEYGFYKLELQDSTDIALQKPAQGSVQYVTKSELLLATIDPLALPQRKMLEGLNRDYVRELKGLCLYYAEILPHDVFVYFADRYGMNIMATSTLPEELKVDKKEADGTKLMWNDVRMPFPFEVHSEREFKAAAREAMDDAMDKLKKSVS